MNTRGVVRIRACSSPLKRDRDETSLPTGSSHAAHVSCPESQLRAGALPGPSRSAPKCRTLPGLRLLKDAGGREPDQGGDKAPFLSRRRILCLKKDDGQCAATGPVGVLSPKHYPTLEPCFLMLGLKRPQTVMEICLHSQILLHMEACVSHLCRRRAPAEQEGGAAIRPKHSGFVTHLALRSRYAGQPLCCAGTG